MNDWIQIISNQWYITLLTHDITWFCCKLNRLSREVKFHWCIKKIINGTTYILSYPNTYPIINKATLLINGTKMSSTCFSQFSESMYLKYLKSLQYEWKYELRISNEMWKHVCRSGVGSYIFNFLFSSYVPDLYFSYYRMW